MKLNEFAAEVHKNAVEHGFWDKPVSFGEIVALCHSELSEALEEYRKGRPMMWRKCMTSETDTPCLEDECGDWADGACKLCCLAPKPEGIAVELCDCILRILDYCGKEGIDIEAILEAKHAYNKGRPYRHGGKTL